MHTLKKRGKNGGAVEIKGVLADRLDADGRRRISLSNDERRLFTRQQVLERAVAMFLDLEAGHSWNEIAEALGMSVMSLKDLTKTDEFMEAYDAHFVELGHDPRLRATEQALADLLPRALSELRRMLVSEETSANVKLAAIKEVFRLAGVQEPKPARSDKSELAEFLKGMGLNVENVNVAVMAPPPPRPQIVDGVIVTAIRTPETRDEDRLNDQQRRGEHSSD